VLTRRPISTTKDTGVARLSSLSMHRFLAADDEKTTPGNIVDLTELDHFEGRSFAERVSFIPGLTMGEGHPHTRSLLACMHP